MTILAFPARARSAPSAAPLADVVALFLVDLRIDGRSSGTIAKHLQEFHRYGRWLAEEALIWNAITPADIQRFARTRVSVGPSARGATFCSLRLFYAWATAQGLVRGENPAAALHTPQRPRPQPRTLKPAHVRTLLAYLSSLKGLRARRDEVLLLTALYTGLRAGELARLRWGDVDLDGNVITIHLSKMNHGRVVPIHPDLRALLLAWQQLQALGSNAPVFSSAHDGEAIVPARVGKVARRVARATGLPLTAHVMRHTFATWTLRKSKDLYAVSKALGHAALKQTEIYVSAEVEQIAAAVATLPSPSEW